MDFFDFLAILEWTWYTMKILGLYVFFETSVILIFKSADYIKVNGRIVLFFSSLVKF